MVCFFENHAEWRLCLFLVPRLTPVESAERVASRSCAVCAQVAQCPSFFSCE